MWRFRMSASLVMHICAWGRMGLVLAWRRGLRMLLNGGTDRLLWFAGGGCLGRCLFPRLLRLGLARMAGFGVVLHTVLVLLFLSERWRKKNFYWHSGTMNRSN